MSEENTNPSDPEVNPEAVEDSPSTEEQTSQPQAIDEVTLNKAKKYDSLYEEMKKYKQLAKDNSAKAKETATVEEQLTAATQELSTLRAEKRAKDTANKVGNLLGNRQLRDNEMLNYIVHKATEAGAVDSDVELSDFVDEFIKGKDLFKPEPSKATEPKEPTVLAETPVAISKSEEVKLAMSMSPEERKKHSHLSDQALMDYWAKKATGKL